jgi:ABC-type glycerol-3-phosphate transport system substrate-binding protein
MYQFARDIVTVDKITNDAPATDWGTMNNLFTGQQAMAVYNGGGMVGLVRSEFPDLFEVLGTCPIPGPEKGQISSFIGGNVASISTQSEHRDESLKFLLWATAEDDGMAVTGDIGFLPGCPSGLELDVYQKDWHLYKAFKDALEFGYPSGNDPRFDEVSLTPLNLAWEQSIIGELPMDEIINTLHTTINGVLQR